MLRRLKMKIKNKVNQINKEITIEKTLINLHKEAQKDFCACGGELMFDNDYTEMFWCENCYASYDIWEVRGGYNA
jgi:hypothetical protein